MALGVLDEADRRALEAHLAEGCAICEAELASLGETALQLAAGAPRRRAPAALRARTIALVRTEMTRAGTASSSAPAPRQAPAPLPLPRRRRAVAAWVWAAAAALLAVTALVQWRETQRLRGDVAAARGERDRVARQLDEERRWTALLDAPQAMRVALAPTPAGAPALRAQMTYDPATRRAVLVCENFQTPAGKDYELWAIGPNGPASLGLVHADAGGRAVVRIPDAGDSTGLAAFAVSLENAGGAPTRTAPAGPVVMVGKVSG